MPVGSRLKTAGRPWVVVSMTDGEKLSGRQLRKSGADMVELRFDRFGSTAVAHVRRVIRKAKPLPVLATIRSRREGGDWKGSEGRRRALFQRLLPQVDAVDIELSSGRILPDVIRMARRLKKTVIVSYHNFRSTPSDSDLKKIAARAAAAGADIVKIAAWVRSAKDLHRLGGMLLRGGPRPMAVIGMGAKGRASRLLFPGMGSVLTYAHAGKSMAPGQLDLTTVHRWLKRLKIQRKK